MQQLALLGIPRNEALVIRCAIDIARSLGLELQVSDGPGAACSADIVVVNGDDPGAVQTWIDLRRYSPDPTGLVVVGPALRSDCPSDEIVRRPFSARGFMTALATLQRRKSPPR